MTLFQARSEDEGRKEETKRTDGDPLDGLDVVSEGEDGDKDGEELARGGDGRAHERAVQCERQGIEMKEESSTRANAIQQEEKGGRIKLIIIHPRQGIQDTQVLTRHSITYPNVWTV